MATRVLILGPPASGKTTLARKWSSDLNLPHIEADQFYWRNPKRKCLGPRKRENFQRDLKAAITGHPCWILEGLGKHTLPLCSELVTHWVWIDCTRLVRITRLFRRSFSDPNAWGEMWMATPVKPDMFIERLPRQAQRITTLSDLKRETVR